VFTLSLILTQASSPVQLIRLLTTAIRAVVRMLLAGSVRCWVLVTGPAVVLLDAVGVPRGTFFGTACATEREDPNGAGGGRRAAGRMRQAGSSRLRWRQPPVEAAARGADG
jgi:hypothetical protein